MNSWKRVLLLAAAALALVCIALEVLSRIADSVAPPAPKQSPGLMQKLAFDYLDPGAARLRDFRTIPHPYLGYVLKPSWHTPEGAAQQCSHNSLGFRGKETTWQKPANTFRILTLGGSSTYGQSESKDSAVWSQRLEDLLEERKPAQKIEVVNGGCSGWTSFEMLGQLAYRGLDLSPDLVILYESVNDMRAALYTAAEPEPERDNTHWRETWPVDRPSAFEKFLQHSRSYLVWRRFFTNYTQERADLGFFAMAGYDPASTELYCNRSRGGYPDGKVPERGFLNYRRNLESILALAQSHGIKVFIATQALMEWDFPPRECAEIQVASFRRIQNIQREVAQAMGASIAETGAAIETEEKRVFEATGKHLFKNDVHPFDEGSELIARTIADALVQQKLVP
ncbi:MAG: SGNH/GDSL hydrolase family protein [Planctomycetes bacterium]|nr:SGNH/GDSL hydrolase family protein [Planctomycetota bacterium]